MQRPNSVTIFGILNIVFGLGGVGGLLSTLRLFSANSSASVRSVTEIVLKDPAYATWLKMSMAPGFVASLVLIVAGVGLLKVREWGRKLSIGYSIYGIVSCIIGIAVNFHYLVRPMLHETTQKLGPESAVMIGAIIGAVVGSIFGLVYPIVLLAFMTRPWMKTFFRPAAPPPLPRG